MNSDFIEWLNNNNNNSNDSSNTTLIECTLILSINGILINTKSLIDYCNNVINNINDNDNDEKVIINNNNKRLKSNIISEDEIKPSTLSLPQSYYGLSKQQFQTIYNNIKNINNNNNNNINNSSTIHNNNNDDTEECISNKIKFTNSISIINENNKRILKQQQQQQQINNIPSSSISNQQLQSQNTFNNYDDNRKNIKSSNCNNNNDNNNSNGIRDIDIVFFKVWRNLVIRNEILFHTRLYNIHRTNETKISTSFDEFSNYKYKSYLNYLEILEEKQKTIIFKPNVLPSNLSEVYIGNNINVTFEVNSIPYSVTTIELSCNEINQEYSKGVFPDSVTYLEFGDETEFDQKLSLEWLPNSLKTLILPNSFQQSIEPNQLPESLTELKLHRDYEGVIVPGSIPLAAANSLDYKFDSNENEYELGIYSIPKSTTRLEFDILFNQTIQLDDIPHNVTSIDLSSRFDSEIQVGSLPLSLKTLKLGNSFNKVISANVLPSNLTSIDMGRYNQPLIPNLFPQSITSITFRFFKQPIPEGYFYNYTNLNSILFIGEFNQVIPVNTLPSSLTTLRLGWGYSIPLNINSLPTSLSKLILMSPNYKLDTNEQLPSSITSLSLNSSLPIPIGSLPCNLNELYIQNPHFNQDITIDGLLPLHSLHSIYINEINLDLINSLDTHFFNKYIKFFKFS